ncbi:MAG: hypothetical protein WC683_18920 [bacterium]
MDSVRYQMDGDTVIVERGGLHYRYTYGELQQSIERHTVFAQKAAENLETMRGAMGYLRERLTLEQANARYATDTQTAWGRMGVKGGAM